MTFADLAVGVSIFLDANPLVYHFASDPVFGPASNQLITRIENREIHAFTSTHVLSETAHHLMTLEASALFGWSSKVVQRLRQDPSAVQQLTKFHHAIAQVPQLGIRVLAIPESLIETAAACSRQIGLLSNDALIVAIMRQHGLTKLASNDPDNDRVPALTRFAPA